MTSCPSCEAAKADPHSELYSSGCEGCDARSLSHSAPFLAAMAQQRMTDQWVRYLRVIAGDEKAAQERLHQRVKAEYIRRMQA